MASSASGRLQANTNLETRIGRNDHNSSRQTNGTLWRTSMPRTSDMRFWRGASLGHLAVRRDASGSNERMRDRVFYVAFSSRHFHELFRVYHLPALYRQLKREAFAFS
jgi:hypothetical protein